MAKVNAPLLFDMPAEWEKAGVMNGLPSYSHRDDSAESNIIVNFKSLADRRAFFEKLGQPFAPNQRSIWYPPAKIGRYADKKYMSTGQSCQKYPIYIISKGRWESRLTSKALEKSGVRYSIVIEPQEFDNYASVIDPAKILVLPFSNLGQGSIPARNWVWDHATKTGARRHWILDDNIRAFSRFDRDAKISVGDGSSFRIIESVVDRYTNVPMAGMNYRFFATHRAPPVTLNTRVYSCILLDNRSDFRWRGRYNEDTDLSIRFLKAGFCTILFNAFLCDKQATMTMAGGNTESLYQQDGRLKMAQSLVDQHPDVASVTEKWGRFQHQVNYKRFKRNKLILDPDAPVESFDMKLEITTDG